MLKTITMSGSREELPIDIGIELDKIEDRIIDKNKYADGYASMYNELCITASEDNTGPVLISDYTESKQETTSTSVDYIALEPKGMLVLPRNREIAALNRPMVMGQSGDILKIVAR